MANACGRAHTADRADLVLDLSVRWRMIRAARLQRAGLAAAVEISVTAQNVRLRHPAGAVADPRLGSHRGAD
jgi:hypothetical protein